MTVTIDRKRLIIVLVTLVLLVGALVGAFVGWPVQRAINAYHVAAKTYDHREACVRANEVAARWAELGFDDNAERWKGTAAIQCLLALK